MQEPDPQVVEAARAGDAAAFEELVRLFQADVFRLALHMLADRDAAEDVAQEAFIRAFRFLRRYRGEARFSTWLFSIARNCAWDEVRRKVRRRQVTERVETRGLVGDQIDSGRGAQQSLEVREALVELPPDLREAIVLIDLLGSSYKEAAAICSVPEGTVKSRVHRARELLSRALEPTSEESSG